MIQKATFLGFHKNLLDLLWVSCLVVLSLPQSVILWTEEDALPEAGLVLVPGGA